MGRVFWGLPTPFVAGIARSRRLNLAIESGTYLGGSTLQLAALFERVITLEADPLFFETASEYLGPLPNVAPVHTESSVGLEPILCELAEPALFFLDAHWFPPVGNRSISYADHPIEREIATVARFAVEFPESVVVVDDVAQEISPSSEEAEQFAIHAFEPVFGSDRDNYAVFADALFVGRSIRPLLAELASNLEKIGVRPVP